MRWALVVLAGCVSHSTEMPPWEPLVDGELGPPVQAVARDTVRIASWNVELAPDPDASAAELADLDADVVLVQEIDAHPSEGATRASRFAAALGFTWCYAVESDLPDGTHGNAIVSRFAIASCEVKRLPRIEQTIRPRERIAQRAVLDLGDGRTLTVVNVHLDTRIGPVSRIRQLDPAVSDNPDDVVIGGDLNTLPWAWVANAVPLIGTEAIVGHDQASIVDAYMRALGFAAPIPHDADTHEFPVDMRLDAIYVRGRDAIASGIAYDAGTSDHVPIWIDLSRD